MQSRTMMASFGSAASLAVLALVQPAVAQQTDQPAASASSGMEEIVVTARRREERVQTVPMAISAFSQTDLEEKHVEQLRDLFKAVPSFAISTSNSDPNSLYSGQVRLRGLQGTEIYFADVPLSNTDYSGTTGLTHGLSPGFYYDLDELEVDKGAQGTLFGRPSIGGLISIQPKRPTNALEGYAQVTLGNFNDHEFEGAINVPIIPDKLLVRIAGQFQERDGYTHDIADNVDLDNRNFYDWRVGVTFRPTDDIENYFVYDGYWQDQDGGSDIIIRDNPAFAVGSIPLGPGFNIPLTVGVGPSFLGLSNPATAAATAGAGIAAGGFSLLPGSGNVLATQRALGPRTIAGRFTSPIGKDYFYGLTDVATWNITDDLTVKNIASARITKQLSTDEFSGTGFPILTIGWPGNNHGWTDNSIQYTEELQLSGKALDDKLDWRVGGFLLFDHPLGYNTEVSTALGGSTYDHFHEEQRSQAIFAHGIYDLSDWVEGMRFTAGYRYTWDFDSLGEVSTKPVDAVTRTGTVANDCNIGGADNNCDSQVNSNFKSFGWNLGLDEQLTPSTLLYVRSGNAYRPGGTNLAVPAPFNRYQPEHATDVEIGFKTDWDFMGVHARTNADYFHTFYKAIQVAEVVTVPSAVPGQLPSAQSITANAAAANLDGFEVEGTFILPEGFELAAHTSYFYSKYDQYPLSFGQTQAPGFQYIPKWTFGITPTYHLPVDESVGKISVSATYTWYGHQSVSPILTEIVNYMPHYSDLDIRIDWTSIMGSTFDAGFFMTNATDNLHIVGVIPLWTSLGFTSVAYNPPRMFGFSLKYRFEPETESAAASTATYTPPPVQPPVAAPAVPKSYLVFFDFDKSDLTPQATQIVDQAARNAQTAKVTRIDVTGHTDTVGSDAYNLRLSQRRAQSVASAMEARGIPASEIAIFAKGKRDLLVPTADGVREPQNRRVEIVYSGGGPTS